MPTFGLCRFMIHTARNSGPPGVTQIRGNEEVVHTELGQVGTQFNALPHIAMGDLLDNCIKVDDLATRTGFTKLGWRRSGPFLHQIMITTYGIFLLENLDLDGFAGERVAEFAFIVLPLKIKGDTGSTVAPLPGNDGERRSSQEGSPDPSCLARAVGRSR